MPYKKLGIGDKDGLNLAPNSAQQTWVEHTFSEWLWHLFTMTKSHPISTASRDECNFFLYNNT